MSFDQKKLLPLYPITEIIIDQEEFLKCEERLSCWERHFFPTARHKIETFRCFRAGKRSRSPIDGIETHSGARRSTQTRYPESKRRRIKKKDYIIREKIFSNYLMNLMRNKSATLKTLIFSLMTNSSIIICIFVEGIDLILCDFAPIFFP